MKMHHKLKQCIISEKRCIRVDYLVTEERPSEFCFEVILYHPDGSEEREEIHNMVMSSDDALEFLHLLARSQVTPTTCQPLSGTFCTTCSWSARWDRAAEGS